MITMDDKSKQPITELWGRLKRATAPTVTLEQENAGTFQQLTTVTAVDEKDPEIKFIGKARTPASAVALVLDQIRRAIGR